MDFPMKAMGFPVLVRLTQIIDSVEYDDAPWSPAKWHSKHPRNLGMPHPNSTTKYYKYSMTKLWWRQAPLPGNQTWQWKSYEITYLEMIFTDFMTRFADLMRILGGGTWMILWYALMISWYIWMSVNDCDIYIYILYMCVLIGFDYFWSRF